MSDTSLKSLVKRGLVGFHIVRMTEVYRIDVDGRKVSVIGYFKDPDVATAFAGAQADANYHKTVGVLVLTDGKEGFVVEDQEPVKFFDDEQEAVALKKKALSKLSPMERKLLGFSEEKEGGK